MIKKRRSVVNNLNKVQSLSVIIGHFKETLTRKSCHFPGWVLCCILVSVFSRFVLIFTRKLSSQVS